MKIELRVLVEYEANGTPTAEIETVLHRAAEHLSDNGLLTGDTSAEAVNCYTETAIVERVQDEMV